MMYITYSWIFINVPSIVQICSPLLIRARDWNTHSWKLINIDNPRFQYHMFYSFFWSISFFPKPICLSDPWSSMSRSFVHYLGYKKQIISSFVFVSIIIITSPSSKDISTIIKQLFCMIFHWLPSSILTWGPYQDRGWKISFHSKMMIFRVYVHLPEAKSLFVP